MKESVNLEYNTEREPLAMPEAGAGTSGQEASPKALADGPEGAAKAKTDEFKDAMAEAAGAIVNHFGDKILYINVVNNLSVDCDCDGHPAKPVMKDIGIVASLDPVALDQACVDMVFNSPDKGNRDLVERIVSRHGTRILYWAQHLGYGSRDYNLVHVH